MSWQTRPRCDETAAWPLLKVHAQAFRSGVFDLRDAFAEADLLEQFLGRAQAEFADDRGHRLRRNLAQRQRELLERLVEQALAEVDGFAAL